MDFYNYESGIYDEPNCGVEELWDLNHTMTLVGWGYDDGLDMNFWLVKNSWGTSCGDNGYYRFAIVEGDGICGIQMDPHYVIV